MSDWLNNYLNSMSPAEKRNHDRRMFAFHIQMKMYMALKWPRWPVLNVVWVFWTSLMEEGIYQTCKPRWGAMTFSYLNDGMKPTLYYLIYGILHPWHNVLYPSGAPRNKKEL